jgi:hypothetical protein
MFSVDPSDSETVPLPDQFPANPANGEDWAKLADADNTSPATRPAASADVRTSLEANSFISGFH